MSPEGLAIDHVRRTMYWTDSGLDKIERARLDGSERKALFHTDLVNPRAIAVDPIRGSAGLPVLSPVAPDLQSSGFRRSVGRGGQERGAQVHKCDSIS